MEKNQMITFTSNSRFNEIDNLISEVSLITQAPKPIIYAAFLSALSSASQGLLDVETIPGTIVPTSLYLLVIAESGERKSTVDGIFSKKFIEINHEIKKSNNMMKNRIQQELDTWNLEIKHIKKQYSKALEKGDDTSTLQEQLHKLHEKKPTASELTHFLYEDITLEALLHNLSKYCPNTTLTSSDAGNLLKKI